MPLEITEVDWSHPDAQSLRARQRDELIALYQGDSEPGPKPTAADVAVFLVGRDPATGAALACGGLRPLEPGVAELKRMFVLPEARGRGLSRLILAALEATAARRSWPVLRLETGELQVEALALYTRSGYTRIENVAHYLDAEHSLCFEKRLGPSPAPTRSDRRAAVHHDRRLTAPAVSPPSCRRPTPCRHPTPCRQLSAIDICWCGCPT